VAHDPFVDIVQVVIAVDIESLGAVDQAHGDGAGFAATLAAREQPVLASDSQRPDRILGRVIVDTQSSISCVTQERLLLVPRIGQGLAQGRGRQSGLGHFHGAGKELPEYRHRFALPNGEPLLRSGVLHAPFDLVKQLDTTQHLGCRQRGRCLGLIKLASGMRPASHLDDIRSVVENAVIPPIGISLQKALVGLEYFGRSLLAPVSREIEEAQGRSDHRQVDPEPGLLRIPAPGNLQVNGTVVGVDHRRGQNPALERLVEPFAGQHRFDGPGVERGGGNLEPLAQENLLLAVDRKVVAPLLDRHQGQHAVVGLALVDRRIGHRGDQDAAIALAVGLHVDRTDEAQHMPVPRLPGGLLADLIAKLYQSPALCIDLLIIGQIKQHIHAFEMLGYLAAPVGTGLAPLGRLDRDGRFCRRLPGGLFAGFENGVHHELVGLVALAAWSEKTAIKLGQAVLKMRDLLLCPGIKIGHLGKLRLLAGVDLKSF